MNGIVTITNGVAVDMAGGTATIIAAMASVGVMVGAMKTTGARAGAATIADAETVAGIAGAMVSGCAAGSLFRNRRPCPTRRRRLLSARHPRAGMVTASGEERIAGVKAAAIGRTMAGKAVATTPSPPRRPSADKPMRLLRPVVGAVAV
jgi:hypothetical protein